MIDFTKISTPELTVFQSTLYSYINEINQTLRNLNIIKNNRGVIYDVDRRVKSLTDKSNEAEKVYELIQKEIERRISKKLKMKIFDYKEIRETEEEVQELIGKFTRR